MNIGIVGAANIGTALAEALQPTGHGVRIANSRHPDTIMDLAEHTGAIAVEAGEVAQGADVVVITIPMAAVADLPADLLDDANEGFAVVDTNNYYPGRDGRIAAIEDGTTESRWVSDQLGHEVVKAFNGIYAADIASTARPREAEGRRALPVAGDDADAKRRVMELVDEVGFDPVDAGWIDDSWRMQPGSPHYTRELDEAALLHALAEASPERAPEWRADG